MISERSLVLWLLFFYFSCVAPAYSLVGDNLYFHGTLVAEACNINPGDEDVALDFGLIADKQLYADSRTVSKPFFIKLSECDNKVASNLKISFSGAENLKMPGFLALDPASQARGIAIGFETRNGQILKLNTLSPKIPIEDGNITIPFLAYIQGEPEALAKRGIDLGPFSATAIFSIAYD